MCNAVSLFRSTTCSSSQRLCWLPSITIMFITFTSLYLTHSLLFSDSQLFHFVETNLFHSWSKILAFLASSTPNPFTLFLNPASSLFDPPPPRSQSVAINFSSSSASHGFSSQRQALSPFSLRSSHCIGRRMNIEAKDGEYMASSSSVQSTLQAGRRPRVTSIRSKFAQFWPTAGSWFDFPQENFIYLYNLTGPIFGYVAVVIVNKISPTWYTPFSLQTYFQWQFVTQIFLIWKKNRMY